MKTIFFEIVPALRLARKIRGVRQPFKEKVNVYKLNYFISKNDFKDC
mgnify:CR=1 FL=1